MVHHLQLVVLEQELLAHSVRQLTSGAYSPVLASMQRHQFYPGAGCRSSAKPNWCIDACWQGRRVVRLKGGCPAVFSRVSSEAAALSASGCSWELVPGVSSALAAPLLAGELRCALCTGDGAAIVLSMPVYKQPAVKQACGNPVGCQ
jgi:hypothetical protein